MKAPQGQEVMSLSFPYMECADPPTALPTVSILVSENTRKVRGLDPNNKCLPFHCNSLGSVRSLQVNVEGAVRNHGASFSDFT